MKQLVLLSVILIRGISLAQAGTTALPPVEQEVPAEPKHEVVIVTDEPPEYPGGIVALKKFLAENLLYPAIAKEAGIEGKRYLQFVVGTDGKISDARVVRGVAECYLQFVVGADGKISDVRVVRGVADCPECDREAVRVVKLMPDWIPGKIGGKPVSSVFNLLVKFELPEEPIEEKK